jgi:hypothetical protein
MDGGTGGSVLDEWMGGQGGVLDEWMGGQGGVCWMNGMGTGEEGRQGEGQEEGDMAPVVPQSGNTLEGGGPSVVVHEKLPPALRRADLPARRQRQHGQVDRPQALLS